MERKPFLPTTDVGLHRATLKVSANETESWNCHALRLVSDNFGKTPPGKRDSTKVEPIHALQSRCQTLRMTTAAIQWKACITKMERVFWAGRNGDLRVRLKVKDTFCLSQLPLCTRASLILKQRIFSGPHRYIQLSFGTWKLLFFLIRITRAAGVSQYFVSLLDFGFYPSGKISNPLCICPSAVPSLCGNKMQALHSALHSFRSF